MKLKLKIRKNKMASVKTLKKMSSGEPVAESELKEKSFYEETLPNIEWNEIKSREDLIIKLAKVTEGYVGADIEAVCREAAILALRENINAKEILPKHFKQALQKVRPSVTKEVQQTYEEMQQQLTAARVKQMLGEKPSYMG